MTRQGDPLQSRMVLEEGWRLERWGALPAAGRISPSGVNLVLAWSPYGSVDRDGAMGL